MVKLSSTWKVVQIQSACVCMCVCVCWRAASICIKWVGWQLLDNKSNYHFGIYGVLMVMVVLVNVAQTKMIISIFNHFIAVGPAQFSVTLLSIVFGFQSHGNSQRTNEYHPHSSAMEDPILEIIIFNVMHQFRILLENCYKFDWWKR